MQVGERLLIKLEGSHKAFIEEITDFSPSMNQKVRLSDGQWYDKKVILDCALPITDYIREDPTSFNTPLNDVILWKPGMNRPVYGKIIKDNSRVTVDFQRSGPFHYCGKMNYGGNGRPYRIQVSPKCFLFSRSTGEVKHEKRVYRKKGCPECGGTKYVDLLFTRVPCSLCK